MSYKNLFVSSGHSAAYQKFRPKYPSALYETIINYIREKLPGPLTRAVDVGCGSGQSTLGLAPYFSDVIGQDVSDSQIEEANKSEKTENAKFRVGGFDNLLAENESTDLVTTALAAHWFDPIEKFYKEADRVLRPNGVLAVYGYGMPRVIIEQGQSQKFNDEMWKFYRSEKVERYKSSRAKMVENLYKDFRLPYADNKRIDDLEIVAPMTLSDFIGYLSSWSFYWKFKETHPDETDPLEELAQTYQTFIGPDQSLEEFKCSVSFPIFLLLGRKPS